MKTFTLAIRITTVVALSLLMVQCGNKQAAPNQSVSDDTTISSYGDKLPIAYINVDSLLSKYNYAKDLNEKMINKQENARASINEKARQLKKEQDDFQRKYQNNAFLSPERAQQEYQRLENENMLEQQKMLMQMNDSINLFIKEYNKEKKYEAIFNNASTLYINPQYDITNEVVGLLNKRYTSAKK